MWLDSNINYSKLDVQRNHFWDITKEKAEEEGNQVQCMTALAERAEFLRSQNKKVPLHRGTRLQSRVCQGLYAQFWRLGCWILTERQQNPDLTVMDQSLDTQAGEQGFFLPGGLWWRNATLIWKVATPVFTVILFFKLCMDSFNKILILISNNYWRQNHVEIPRIIPVLKIIISHFLKKHS